MTREERIMQLQQAFIDGQKYDIKFNKFLWRGKTRNCLAYALNLVNVNEEIIKHNTFGLIELTKMSYSPMEMHVIFEKVFISMNIKYKICSYKKKVPKGYYKIAMLIETNDVHWIRQDSDGTWSHKPGWKYKPQNKDRQGKIILNPEKADIAISGELLEIYYFLIPHKNYRE